MDNIADIIIQALPWLEGVIDAATVSISALPSFGELIDSATVAVSALPRLVIGLPIWLYGVIGGGFITWSWRELS